MAILNPRARTQLIQALKTQKAKGALIAFDFNYRPKLWESKALAQQITSEMWSLSDLAAFLQGKSEMTCLMRAHSVASHVVQFSGAIVQEESSTEKCDY
jgi:sugar/nucleoside kinase (ribokinase family)